MRGEQTCATCAHFAALPKECRARSPLGIVLQGPNGQPAVMGYFPSTKAENWCGEWRAESLSLSGVN